MDSQRSFRKNLNRVSAIVRSQWTSRLLLIVVLIAFVNQISVTQVKTLFSEMSFGRIFVAVVANIFLLGLFSKSWAITVKAVSGVEVSASPFVLSQPLKLIPGAVAQPVFLANQYHNFLSTKLLVASLVSHALVGIVVPAGLCLVILIGLRAITTQEFSGLLMASAGVMTSPLLLMPLRTRFVRRTNVDSTGGSIPKRSTIQVMIIGVLGLICYGVTYSAISADFSFDHALLFGGSVGFGLLMVPFPSGLGPREWFFMQFSGAASGSIELVAFLGQRILQILVEVFFALSILAYQVRNRSKSS